MCHCTVLYEVPSTGGTRIVPTTGFSQMAAVRSSNQNLANRIRRLRHITVPELGWRCALCSRAHFSCRDEIQGAGEIRYQILTSTYLTDKSMISWSAVISDSQFRPKYEPPTI